jgi:hypothetical protein
MQVYALANEGFPVPKRKHNRKLKSDIEERAYHVSASKNEGNHISW